MIYIDFFCNSFLEQLQRFGSRERSAWEVEVNGDARWNFGWCTVVNFEPGKRMVIGYGWKVNTYKKNDPNTIFNKDRNGIF